MRASRVFLSSQRETLVLKSISVVVENSSKEETCVVHSLQVHPPAMTVDAGRMLFLSILCLIGTLASSALLANDQHVTIGNYPLAISFSAHKRLD